MKRLPFIINPQTELDITSTRTFQLAYNNYALPPYLIATAPKRLGRCCYLSLSNVVQPSCHSSELPFDSRQAGAWLGLLPQGPLTLLLECLLGDFPSLLPVSAASVTIWGGGPMHIQGHA